MRIKANSIGLDLLGLDENLEVHRNLSVKDLVQDIINNKEGIKGLNGSSMVDTGVYTGRSPKDKYIVSEKSSEKRIWWGEVNRKISEKHFEILYKMALKKGRPHRLSKKGEKDTRYAKVTGSRPEWGILLTPF